MNWKKLYRIYREGGLIVRKRGGRKRAFTSRAYTKLVRSYGLTQEFITPHYPQQNDMMERLIRSLKEQCVHRQPFESPVHASRATGDWIQFYNRKGPHQAILMRTQTQAFKLAG